MGFNGVCINLPYVVLEQKALYAILNCNLLICIDYLYGQSNLIKGVILFQEVGLYISTHDFTHVS